MMRLGILNMKDFLEVVNGCGGDVNIVYPNGKKKDIRRCGDMQRELENRHRLNKNYLTLTLDVPDPKDYLNIVYYVIAGC